MLPWALITGASTGIGLELARVFARNRHNLILVARNEPRLHALAAELQSVAAVECLVLPQDLSRPGAAATLFDRCRHKEVSVLVNNAGVGSFGAVASTDLQRLNDLMQVNMTALVELTHYCLHPMLARKSGRILNVASVAAFVPGPTVNLYYASKAFVYSFSYALAEEVEAQGVTVTTLCPGSTRTEFFDRAGVHMKRPYPMMSAHDVAEIGFRGLMKGKRVVIPGFTNRLMAFLVKRLPPRIPAKMVRRIHAQP